MGLLDEIKATFTGQDSAPVATASSEISPDAGGLASLKSAAKKGGRRLSRHELDLQETARQADLDKLFEDENWEELASLYFDARFVMTGWDGFELEEKQRRILGKSMGASMRMLLAIDPKWIALIIFVGNFGKYVTTKEVAYSNYRKVLAARGVTTNGQTGT